MMETENVEKKDEKVEKVEKVEKEAVDRLIRHHMYSAFGIGLIPVPLLDMAALTGVQLNLLRKLAKLYEIPFSKDKVKNILTSLVGGAAPVAAGMPAASYLKLIPVVGYSLGAVSMSTMAAAATYAVGKVFNQHFASGGTFLSFDTEKVRDYYAKMFKKGKDSVADLSVDDIKKETDKGDKNTKADDDKAKKKAA